MGSKVRKLRVPLGDVPLHLRGGTIVPMQKRPALVARDVRLLPVTLVVALPSAASIEAVGPVPAYALEESCNAARAQNLGRRVACGNLFMDSGEDLAVSTDNSVQVRCVGQKDSPLVHLAAGPACSTSSTHTCSWANVPRQQVLTRVLLCLVVLLLFLSLARNAGVVHGSGYC